MVTVRQARELALRLPEALEADHHGFPSFRVRGKVFATLPDETHMNVMIESDAVRIAVAENAGVCEELWWGKRLACVRVVLPAAGDDLLGELLTDAWRRKAPVTLVRRHET